MNCRGDATRECTCSAGVIARYQKHLSGPLLDRIDIHIAVPRVAYEKLTDRRDAERSVEVRARVRAARERQAARFAGAAGTRLACNADMGPAEVRTYCGVEPAAEPLLRAATQRLQLSARAFHRVLKLARTIADLAGSDCIAAPHVAEALQYRPRVDVG
jgi:magnesium chelatase family protein